MAEVAGEGHRIARAFIAAAEAGELPGSLLARDFSAWTTLQGDMPGDDYRNAIRLMKRMTEGTLAFTVVTITAEDDRAVIEARSTARLIDGSDYANSYVFSLRFDGDRLTRVSEHFNALVVHEKLIPLMKLL